MDFCLPCHKNPVTSGGWGLTPQVLAATFLKTPKKSNSRRMGRLNHHYSLGGTLSSVQVMTGHSLFLQVISERTILTVANNRYSCMMQQVHGFQHPPCDNLMRRKQVPNVEGQSSHNPSEFLYEKPYQVRNRN